MTEAELLDAYETLAPHARHLQRKHFEQTAALPPRPSRELFERNTQIWLNRVHEGRHICFNMDR